MPSCKFAEWLADPAHRVAVIGASGWIGRALTDRVLNTSRDLAPERLRLFGSRARPLTIGDRQLPIDTLSPDASLGDGRWLVLHSGIIGADRIEGGDPDAVRRRNDAMLAEVLSLSETGAAERLVFFSSGAAGRPEAGGAAKQAYARMKLAHEAAVTAWGRATGTPVLIPRVFNLGGPYINHTQAYALGDFILQYARTGRIRISSAGRVSRDFVHVLDMAHGVLHMAADPQEDEAPFDIGLQGLVELDDLARAVARAFDGALLIERPADVAGADDDYGGDGRRFQKALRQCGVVPASLDRIVADTLAYLRRTGEIPASAT